MKKCNKCGFQVYSNTKTCPSCGNVLSHGCGSSPTQKKRWSFGWKNPCGTDDQTAQFDSEDIEGHKWIAVLSYFGILVFVPLFAVKDSPFVRFHTGQGLVLFFFSVAYGVASHLLLSVLLAISWRFYSIAGILQLPGIVFLALAVVGIVNAAQGRAKELPLIGGIMPPR